MNIEAYPKIFYVKGKLKVLSWKLLNENFTHLSYNVKKAKFINSNFDITAYYSDDLPSGFGLKRHNMLPEVILILEIVNKRSKEKNSNYRRRNKKK